jgi:DNA-binding NarL/FixJ family response regulator
VVVLAQDLIWQTRLAFLVEGAGGRVTRARSVVDLTASLGEADALIVDLTAHAYDPVEAIERAKAAGARVLAVGQHDDHPLRKRALGAGAERVFAYRKLHEDGPTTIGTWLAAAASPVVTP